MIVKNKSHTIEEQSDLEHEHYLSPSKNIVIKMDLDIIQNKAIEISQKGFSWDELNWLIGEYEIRLSKAIEGNPNLLLGSLSSEISLNPTYINNEPDVEKIRSMASNFSTLHLPLNELQWDLAVRDYIFQIFNQS